MSCVRVGGSDGVMVLLVGGGGKVVIVANDERTCYQLRQVSDWSPTGGAARHCLVHRCPGSTSDPL